MGDARPLCFVLMPFGKKTDPTLGPIDFDAVYAQLIAPAVEESGLDAIRADQELTGGVIHKPMFERLMLCDYAIADLTSANPNVFYELGIRHAIRPHTTVMIYAQGGSLPFDVALDRAMPYGLLGGVPHAVEQARSRLTASLRAARHAATDSPLFQLLPDFPPPEIQRLKTDVFRERAQYSQAMKGKLETAREKGSADAVREVEGGLGPLDDVEAGILVDLLISYRAVGAHQDMVSLVERMPAPVANTPLVREQLGFALNRLNRYREAERVLSDLLARRGPSSETYGLLGRVYKDQWEAANKQGRGIEARGFLRKAIDTYVQGFEADWRDAYPGINAVTLMAISDPPDPRLDQLLPVVRYAVERRLHSGKADYWDHATRLELAVLAKDEDTAAAALEDAMALAREPWEKETTARNLRLIRQAREARKEDLPWAAEAEQTLLPADDPDVG